jgi:ribose transport system permease protein
LAILGGVIAVTALSVPHFLTRGNVVNILVQSSALGMMAIGLTAVLIGGGIDLSVPSIMALSGILGAMLMRAGGAPGAAALAMLAVAISLGAINGCAIAYLKMVPFVVTLSMMYIATGASIWVTNAVSVTGLHPAFIASVTGRLWGVPVPVVMLSVCTVLATVLMGRSLYGRWLYAVGTNAKAARNAGIPSDQVLFGTYVWSGFFAGLAAIITTARLGSAAATMGHESVVLDVISAAVVGGVSIYGGVGSPLGAVIGAIFITLISNAMNLMHVEYYTTLAVKGAVIVTVVALDSLRRR